MVRLAALPAVLLAIGLTSPEDRPAGPVISSAKLLQDVDVLERIYEAAHPGLYRYNTRAQIDAHYHTLRAEFARDRTLGEAFVAVSQFLAKLKCGHSYTNFVNQPKAVTEALFQGRNRVPFLFRWIDGRMVVTRDLTPDGALPRGTEILALNGVPAPEVLRRLMTVSRADGSNDAKRIAQLEVRGAARYEAFDIFFPLMTPTAGGRIALVAKPPGAKESVSLTVDALDASSRAELARTPRGAEPGDGAARWKFETLDGGIAYLRMPTWSLFNDKWDWKGFLDRGMDDLIDRRVPALIIDLRDNEGGMDIGDALIERVATREIREGAQRRYTRYRALPTDLLPYLDTWDRSFRDWGDKATPEPDGFFRMTKYDDAPSGPVIAPRGRRYEGRLIVLVNAANSSATFQFAHRVKENRLGTLVGQTTGGNLRGINGGAFFFATLPNSRIEVDLPLIATFPEGPRPDGRAIPFRAIPDAGVEPDVPVRPTVEEIAQGIDPELRAARGLLAR